MKPTFNLVTEPWLPCLRLNGERDELSLRDMLTQAHHLRELYAESPLISVALYRLLLAILYRIFQPQSRSDWLTIWQTKQFDIAEIDAYFNQPHIQERFDLFHETHPFYQTTEEIGKPLSLAVLAQERASGNNPTLFDHAIDSNLLLLSPAKAVQWLLATHAFALGGGKSGLPGRNFTDALCSRGILCLAEGDNLFETLAFNLVPYQAPGRNLFDTLGEEGIPAWEMDNPLEPDRTSPDGVLDYLTWQSRRLKLVPRIEDGNLQVVAVYRSQGLSLDKDILLLDPMKPYRQSKKEGLKPILLWEGRALWRDSSALFRIPGKEDLPAAVFDWLSDLCDKGHLPSSARYRWLAFGLATEPGKATVHFSRAERIPFPLAYLTEPLLVTDLDTALAQTERVAGVLIRAVRRAGMFLQLSNPETTKWPEVNKNAQDQILDWVRYTGIERTYWSALEIPFRRFMVDLAEDRVTALADWRTRLRKTATSAFEQIGSYVGDDGRSLKAVVRGRQALNYNLRQILASPKEDQI